MKCSTARRLLVKAEGSDDRGLGEHLLGCEECRRLRDLIGVVARSATPGSLPDVSGRSMLATRRQAARLMAARKDRAAQPKVFGLPRLALAAVVPLVVMLAGALVYTGLVRGRSDSLVAARESVSAPVSATLDERIETLQHSVDTGLTRFRATHRSRLRKTRFELAAARLRRSIELCSDDLAAELGGAHDARPQGQKTKKEIRNERTELPDESRCNLLVCLA